MVFLQCFDYCSWNPVQEIKTTLEIDKFQGKDFISAEQIVWTQQTRFIVVIHESN